MTSAESTQAEAIVQVATRLFAALGYDGTTTRQIAEAAGLNIATVSYHVGGKRELYLAVMENAHRVERAALESAIAEFSGRDTATLVHGIVDRYLDFCVAHRDVATLWMHRWLSDAADISDLEQRYTHPLATLVLEAVEGAGGGGVIAPDVDLPYALHTVVWCISGFGSGGVVGPDGRRHGFDDPAALSRFRAHLHRLVHRMLALPGDPP